MAKPHSGFRRPWVPTVAALQWLVVRRLWDAEKIHRRRKHLRRKKRKPRKKGRKGEKLESKHPGVLKRLFERLERCRGQPLPLRPETLLQKIFRDFFVRPSAQQGLLGDTQKLVLAGDGIPLCTGASPYGKRVCACKEQGIKSCQCPRAYANPAASWGWDSYRDRWFYDRHLYEWTAGHAMCYDGFCKGRGRHKWRCPLMRARTANQIQCPDPCSESAYGRVRYTYHEDNLRFFPRIARGTEAWKTEYAKRTSVERSYKRKKVDDTLEATRVRSTVAWTWRSILTAMCQHIDAWHKASHLSGRDLVNAWLPGLTTAA